MVERITEMKKRKRGRPRMSFEEKKKAAAARIAARINTEPASLPTASVTQRKRGRPRREPVAATDKTVDATSSKTEPSQKIYNDPAKAKTKPDESNKAFDKWMRQSFVELRGPWVVEKIQNDYVITDSEGKEVATTKLEHIAATISILPEVACTYMRLMEKSELTELELEYYQKALSGLYVTISELKRRNGIKGNSNLDFGPLK